MSRAERIRDKLNDGLRPRQLDVVDDSHRHEGHGGWRPEGETHFRVTVVSEAFAGKPRVQRQQLVYGLLKDELDAGLHALQLKTLTPEEAGLD
ncbi:MAG: BolA family protein [Rhodovibrionaceae bacterium]|nr:BolA family protein [Rhodovibrionaceae bacterium]